MKLQITAPTIDYLSLPPLRMSLLTIRICNLGASDRPLLPIPVTQWLPRIRVSQPPVRRSVVWS